MIPATLLDELRLVMTYVRGLYLERVTLIIGDSATRANLFGIITLIIMYLLAGVST